MSVLGRLAVVVIVAAVGYHYFFNNKSNGRIPSVEGYVHPRFQALADLFRQQVESGLEPGAAYSVYHQGELVVDLRGGWADREAEREWSQDTVTMVFSVSKGVAAILAAKMVDRGWLDYDRPVAHYWPEFHIKNVTVGMLLSHQAGLVMLDKPLRLQQLVEDKAAVERSLTSQQPAWPPGTATGYHTITFGLYVDTLLQKAHPQKKNISQIFEEEIGKPFGIEFYFGLPRHLNYRVARMERTGDMLTFLKVMADSRHRTLLLNFFGSNSLFAKTGNVFGHSNVDVYNNPDLQAIGLSSMLGFTSARHLAKLYGILANGGTYKGKQLLKPETLAKLQKVVVEGLDAVLGIPLQRSYGLFVNLPEKGMAGHNGYGGSLGFMDWKRKIGVGYSTNFNSQYPSRDPRIANLVDATILLVDSLKA